MQASAHYRKQDGIRDGWLAAARRRPSPNCDLRPAGTAVDLLVVHGISLPPGQFGGPAIEQFFTNTLDCDGHPYFARLRGMRVSSHLLIRRDGELVQFVPLHLRAWHAGASEYGGRPHCNDFAIGVELEGTDQTAYDAVQYRRLAWLAGVLMRHCPGLGPERIVGHSDIAPGRKTDPGPAFDWAAFRRLLDETITTS
jgi:AmpD protein